jgi:hypothetical protein
MMDDAFACGLFILASSSSTVIFLSFFAAHQDTSAARRFRSVSAPKSRSPLCIPSIVSQKLIVENENENENETMMTKPSTPRSLFPRYRLSFLHFLLTILNKHTWGQYVIPVVASSEDGLLQFGKKPYARKKKVLVFGVRELT